jgi:non-specific serine/threonine protein kinase
VRTSFVGREQEVAEIKRLLANRQLLTLCGPGGAGKTRLALAVAQDLVEGFEGDVWWVGLASISDPELVPGTVASALGVPESPELSPTDALVDNLKGRKALLVLDNCEHLVEACVDLADVLLLTCPDLKLLATSREPLRVAGETSFMVPSLSLPEPGRSSSTEDLAGYEAVRLFVERARVVDAGFALTERNAAALARLCNELDGIPLAIELAAVRTRVLTVEQILQKLEDPLGLLTTGSRTAAARHRTLRATLQWSYDLLSDDERALFRRLSVFAGGWDLEAAEAVGAGDTVEPVLDLLSALVDKSLVVVEADAEDTLRYTLLEPVRQFARDELRESGEEADLRRRHAGHYLSLAERAEPELLGPNQGLWLGRLRSEFANLREAHSWSLESGQEEDRVRLRLRLPAALWRFWGGRRFEEGKRWLQTALEKDTGGFPADRAQALDGLGFILTFQHEFGRAIEVLEESIALYEELGDRSGAALALANLGYAVLHGGYHERVPAFLEKAKAFLAEDLNDHARAYLRITAGLATFGGGDPGPAVAQIQEGLDLSRELGDSRNTSMALFILGMLEFGGGDPGRGAPMFEEGARMSQEIGDRLGGIYFVWGFGKLSVLRGSPVRAATLWGAAEALREQMGMALSHLDLAASGYEQDLAAVRSTLGEVSFDAAWAEGRAMSFEQSIDYALEERTDQSFSDHPPAFGSTDTSNREAQRLFGREGEQVRLRQLLDEAIGGRGGFVLIGGEAGIGKTALATSIAHEASGRGIPVWVGNCYEFVATPPYGPWMESGIFDGPVGDVLPPPMLRPDGRTGAAGSQTALFEQMQAFLTALTRKHPVVLILEDLHWSDPASLELLRFVSRNVAELGALLVVTYRDDEVTRQSPFYGLLPTLVRESGASRMELRRLGESAVREMVADGYDLPEADEGRLVSYLTDLTAGNAFFTIELLRTLEEELVLHREGEGWVLEDPGGIRVPSLLRQIIEGRLERLGEETRGLLAVAAVIGQEVPFDLWQAVGEADDERLAEAMGRALEAHLIKETPGGERLRFVHALVRETLYRELALPFRQRWHRRVAEALEQKAGSDPEEVANHFRQARDPRAEGWLIRAGLRAEETYAWMTAVERFVAALEFLREDDARKKGWLLFRIGVLLRYSDTARSISYLDLAEMAANEVGDGVLAVNSLFTRGSVRCMSGDMRPGLAEIEASIAAARRIQPADRSDEADAVLVLEASPANEQGLFGTGDLPEGLQDVNPATNTLVEWLAHVGRYEEAVELGEEYVARVSAASPDGNLTFAMCNNAYFGLGVARAGLGRPEEARRWFALTHEAYRRFDHRVMDSFAVANELLLVGLVYYPERVAERRWLADVELGLQKRGAGAFSGEVPPLEIGRQWLRTLEGEWTEASRLMELGRGAFDAGALRQYAVCTLGEIARNRGEPERAWRHVYEVLPLGVATEPGGNRFFSALAILRLAANLSLDAQDFPGARAWLEAHDRWLDWSNATLWCPEGRLLWARYHHEQGEGQAARQHAEAAIEFATEPRQPLALLAAHRFLGELATGSGRFPEAAEHIDKSLGLAESCEAPYERALTLISRSQLLVARGDTEEARSVLDEVQGICVPLGAEPALVLVAELEERLQTQAQAAPAPSDTPAARSGLTKREIEILQLVAQGMINQEIAETLVLSEHTVHRHVSNVMGKMGVSSRTAAVAEAARLDLL